MKVDIRDYDYGPHPSQRIRLFLPSGRYLTVVVALSSDPRPPVLRSRATSRSQSGTNSG